MKQRQFIVKKVLVKRLFSFLVKHNPHVTTFLKYKFFRKRKVFLMLKGLQVLKQVKLLRENLKSQEINR